MKIGFVVNDRFTEKAGYTTTRLGMSAVNLGHEAWVISVADFSYDQSEKVLARAVHVPKKRYKSNDIYYRELMNEKLKSQRIDVGELDILMLRNNPADDTQKRPWATLAGVMFGRLAAKAGVIVLNDPNGLSKAENKMYFQSYPEEVRPRTLITRDPHEIKSFLKSEGGKIILKPLQGSGGTNVFLITKDNMANMNQIIEAISRDGFVIAQEYLPKAVEGDVRLFVMNGRPLKHKGRYAAFRRVRQGDDLRSNVHAGGTLARAQVTDEMLRVAEIVRPKLVEDGMFLVGLDIVGDKLMEINVFSPGGLGSAQKMERVDFNPAVIQALEKKVDYMKYYRRKFDNVDMATL